MRDLQTTYGTYVSDKKKSPAMTEWTEMFVDETVTFGDKTADTDAYVTCILRRDLKKQKSPEEHNEGNAIAMVAAMPSQTRTNQSTVPDKSKRGNLTKSDRTWWA